MLKYYHFFFLDFFCSLVASAGLVASVVVPALAVAVPAGVAVEASVAVVFCPLVVVVVEFQSVLVSDVCGCV